MIKIIGIGHGLKRSINEVRETILAVKPNFVAIELDKKRYEILKNNFDLNFERFKFSPNIIEFLLAMFQREVGKKFNIIPGAEMREAILCAREVKADIVLIDRDIDITMNRILNLPLNEKINMIFLPINIKNIESILEPENLEKITNLMKKFPKFYKGLVEERDLYMAINLYSLQSKFPNANIVAVIGAGHKKGVEKFLNEIDKKAINADINAINRIEKISPISFFTNILFAFILIFALIFLKLNTKI